MAPDKEQLQALLADYVEGSLSEQQIEEAEAYLAANPAVRQVVDRLMIDSEALRALPTQRSPVDFSEEFRASAERDLLLGGPARPPARRQVNGPMVALAALLAIGLGLGGAGYWLLAHRPASGTEFARVAATGRSTPDATATDAPGDAPADREARLREPAGPADALAQDVTPAKDDARQARALAVAPGDANDPSAENESPLVVAAAPPEAKAAPNDADAPARAADAMQADAVARGDAGNVGQMANGRAALRGRAPLAAAAPGTPAVAASPEATVDAEASPRVAAGIGAPPAAVSPLPRAGEPPAGAPTAHATPTALGSTHGFDILDANGRPLDRPAVIVEVRDPSRLEATRELIRAALTDAATLADGPTDVGPSANVNVPTAAAPPVHSGAPAHAGSPAQGGLPTHNGSPADDGAAGHAPAAERVGIASDGATPAAPSAGTSPATGGSHPADASHAATGGMQATGGTQATVGSHAVRDASGAPIGGRPAATTGPADGPRFGDLAGHVPAAAGAGMTAGTITSPAAPAGATTRPDVELIAGRASAEGIERLRTLLAPERPAIVLHDVSPAAASLPTPREDEVGLPPPGAIPTPAATSPTPGVAVFLLVTPPSTRAAE